MSINPRDQLAAGLAAKEWRYNSPHAAHAEHIYDGGCAICRGHTGHIAAAVVDLGWRPPPRVITTQAELDALPDGSVVLHDECSDEIGSACVWVKGCDMWSTNGHNAEYDSEDLISHCDPGETLTVLHEPEEAR